MLAPLHIAEQLQGINWPVKQPTTELPQAVDVVICSICFKLLQDQSEYTDNVDGLKVCVEHLGANDTFQLDDVLPPAAANVSDLFSDPPREVVHTQNPESLEEKDSQSVSEEIDIITVDPEETGAPNLVAGHQPLKLRVKRKEKSDDSFDDNLNSVERRKKSINAANMTCPCGRKIVNHALLNGLFGTPMCAPCSRMLLKASKASDKVRLEVIKFKDTVCENSEQRAKEYMEYVYREFSFKTLNK